MMRILCFYIVITTMFTGIWSCEAPDRPLDADTKQMIDSISSERIRVLRAELDSQCVRDHKTLLPVLVDSIKKERLKQIEEKLRLVPKGL